MLETVTLVENHRLSEQEPAPYANPEMKRPFQYISYALQRTKAARTLRGDQGSSSGLLLNDCSLIQGK